VILRDREDSSSLPREQDIAHASAVENEGDNQQNKEHHGNMITSAGEPLTFARQNERNAQFWSRESKLTEERASDAVVCQFALRDIQFDADRGKHLRELSFEVSLAKGEMAKKLFGHNSISQGWQGSPA
jgi:hypothetical protein